MMDTSAHHSDVLLLEELENNRQELHAARRHIEILTANVRHLENDNTELNNILSEKSQLHKNSQSCDTGKTDAKYRQEMAACQEMLEEALTSDREAKETIKKLEEQLRVAVETASSAAPLSDVDNDEEIAALQLKILDLEEEKSDLKLKLYENALELKQKTDQVTRLQQELAEKDEEIECMESQFTTQCSISERLREENLEMRAQLETETGHVDVGKKGNSLFAEVDDRRIIAEKKIVKVESVMRELEEKLTKEQKENKRLKLQILLLRQTSSKGYDDSVVKNLQGQLMESKRTIISLTEQLQTRQPSLKHNRPQEAKISVAESATDSDKIFINFLQGIITQKTKEAEEAKAEAQQNHLQTLRTEIWVTEFKHEVMTVTNECDRLKVMNSHLTMAIQEMQRKYEPELFAPPSKEKIKIPLGEPEHHLSSQNNKQQQNVVAPGSGYVPERTPPHKNFSAHEAVSDENRVIKGIDKHSKENVPLGQSDVAGTWQGKSVRMMSQVDVISSQGEHNLEELKADGQGQKVKKIKGAGGTGKYRSVNHMNVDSQPTECNQQ
ncbi:unnamed protein product [Candidula unifasciata]|uniref:Uncharacterized protein n=1 Tax=Candidula unifasciata TaxID=100452 RepID=A0A8S3YTL7_9EUPU|nr:unnamed protein product [Candidula unifasciata]